VGAAGLGNEVVKAGLQTTGTPECPRPVAEWIDLDPGLEIRRARRRGPDGVATRRLRLEVQAGRIREPPVPHDATGIVDHQTVAPGGEYDEPRRGIRAA